MHQAFLARLKSMLPAGCQPIVITDAGFRSPWFRAVEAQGWHWVGRKRNREMLREYNAPDTPAKPNARWFDCKRLYDKASTTALDLGRFECVRNHPHLHRLVLIKAAPKGRIKVTAHGEKCRSNHSQKQARAQREPWLLAASLSLAHLSAQTIVNLYTQRMQIEQSFRDTKNARWGLGLSESQSRSPERLAVLALIASLAEFVFRLIGQCAIKHHLQYDLQLTNRKSRPEISVIRAGKLLINAALCRFTAEEFRQTMRAWTSPHWARRT